MESLLSTQPVRIRGLVDLLIRFCTRAAIVLAVSVVACSPARPLASSAPAEPSSYQVPVSTVSTGVTDIEVSRREQSEAIAECAALKGVAVEVDPSGDGVVWKAPEGQEFEYSKVIDQCALDVAERFGVPQGAPGDADLERWYRAFLWTHQCMIEHGYLVEDPPSVDIFIDSGGSAWHPYNAVIKAAPGEIKPGVPFSEEAFRELEAACPQDLVWLLDHLDL